MSGHTPGPWTVVLRGERGTFHIPEAQKHEAQHSDDGVDGYTVSKANARLIAAAPELLEALKDLVAATTAEVNEKGGGGFVLARLTDARTAIAKAEGRKP